MYKLTYGQYELTKESKEQKFQCTLDLTGNDIENIVVTALEGGIGHWATLDNSTPEWERKPRELPVSQFATQLLLENKGIRLIDEEDEEKSFELTLQKLLAGVELYINHEVPTDIDDIDAAAADMIFQYALFGEIVYS